MMMRRSHMLCAAALSAVLFHSAPAFAVQATQQATQPATQAGIVLPDGPLTITITGIEGNVQTRTSPDQKWERAKVGQQFPEGTELRTSMKSAVRFSIGDNQIITLDRLGTVQILRANFENGKFVTDLGMKYGRTRYDIEGAGREYDAKVHSPNSVLAVRGTKVLLFDQPPFAPEAVSFTGQAMFRDVRKQTSVGSRGGSKAKVSTVAESTAEYSRGQSRIDPKSEFSGRTETDRLLQLSLAVSGGSDFSDLGVLAFLDEARAGQFKGTLVGVFPVGKQLEFDLTWFGSTGSEIDLKVISPLGETVSITNRVVASGGEHSGPSKATDGFGFQTVIWPIEYPKGVYTVTANYISGGIEGTIIQVTEDKNSDNGRPITTQQPTINAQSPSFTFTVDPQNPPPQPPLSLTRARSRPPVAGPQRPPVAGPRRR
ncbi:MAG: hypothetical protein H7Z14_13650 [Anaerolineae bacterium]|nr:hypothetical protein [Phycisphaerae bacterium]